MPNRMTCRCLLVESDARLLLVDTGFGTLDVEHPRRLGPLRAIMGLRLQPSDTAEARIAWLGFDPASVSDIAITHLDLDHTGGLADFPNARVHISAAELDAAEHRVSLTERLRYRPAHWSHQPKWAPKVPAASTPWCALPSIILPEPWDMIRLVSLPGHTRGHCGVAIPTTGGWLLHAGDSYYSRDELSAPFASMLLRLFRTTVDVAPNAAGRTLDALRALRDQPDLEIVCSHDPRETVKACESPASER
jgi:glyoxylase-like metal-dependent hydrolase (beta-lactamase superfamily II)